MTKIKDFYFEEPFSFWFKFYWGLVTALDLILFILFTAVQRGRLVYVKYCMWVVEARLLITCC